MFDELDKIGALLTEEAQDGGLPVHDGKGDLHKCPYYATKLGGFVFWGVFLFCLFFGGLVIQHTLSKRKAQALKSLHT